MSSIDPVSFAFANARRWGARVLFRFTGWILRGSIMLYEQRRISPIILRTALATVRILERSARMLLFGYKSVRGRKYPDRSPRQ
jgi:hypothetical protein